MLRRNRKGRLETNIRSPLVLNDLWIVAGTLLVVILSFSLGFVYQWTPAIYFSLFVLLFLIFIWVQSKSRLIKEKLKSTGIILASLLLALILTGWIVLFEISILPSHVNIKFSKIYTTTYSFPGEVNRQDKILSFIHENVEDYPQSQPTPTVGETVISKDLRISQLTDVVGNMAVIQVQAVPKPGRVYILIHPHNTQFWYVQAPLKHRSAANDPNGYWEGVIYFGHLDDDCGMKYDLIALGTKDPLLLDIFRGRGLTEGKALDYLPVLNQSDIILVRKECN